MLRRSLLRPVACSLFVAALGLAGCSGGMTIHNTSDHDVTFVRQVQGGEISHTLHPGAELTLPKGSRIRMPEYVIVDE